MPAQLTEWTALLIGGSSGVGKTAVAEYIGRHFQIQWLQVDDLRLALQWSQVQLPQGTEALYFFLEHPRIWTLSPERLRDGLIAVGEVMSPAIEVIVGHHVETGKPIVIEGDGILPALFLRPDMGAYRAACRIRAVFLVEAEETTLLDNMRTRARDISERNDEELRTEARAIWLYGQWLADEACRLGLPVLEPRPWDTLAERIVREAAG